jgi:lipopolysaccharide export system protein LptC
VPGLLRVKSAGGYRIDASNVAVDLKTRSLIGQNGVNGTLNIGTFSANQLTADLDKRIVRLQGNARLRINQGVIK